MSRAGWTSLTRTFTVEDSLRRLGTDRIDLLYLHQWDGETPLEETLQTLDQLVRSGKVRYTGVSNFAGWQIAKTTAVARQHGLVPPIAQQVYYMPQVVLAWLLGRPGVTDIVFGARTEEQLRDDLDAVDVDLTNEKIRRIDEVGQPAAQYPFWHRAMLATDRPDPAEAPYLDAYAAAVARA